MHLTDHVVSDNKKYSVHTGISSEAAAEIEIVVFLGMEVVFRKVLGFSDLVEQRFSDQDDVLIAAMRSLHQGVVAALSRGLLPPRAPNKHL